MGSRQMKRLLDLLLASLLLVLFAPLMIGVALAIRILDGPPVLFCQRRPGRGGRPFVLLKFRTMREARDAQGRLLPDGQRLTPLGCWLRRTSLDELPTLFNVLKGEMSLVGPRPLLMEYLDRYTEEQARRHEVKPGITGWAQIHGRNEVSWGDRFRMDVWYVDHWNLVLDLKILCLTVIKVLNREGISARGHATMPLFLPAGGSANEAE